MIKVSPSKLELCCACPAAPARNLPFPFVESEASKRGSHLHEVTALVLDNLEEFEGLTAELEEADKAAVKVCVEVAQMLMPKGKRIIFIEERMDLGFLMKGMSGKPDLAYYDVASKTVCVVDWKFGRGPVPDPTDNKQLMAYSLALRDRLKVEGFDVLQAYLVICQPSGTAKQSYRDAHFPAQIFPSWEKEIKDAVQACQEKDAPAIPGVHCKRAFCEAGRNGACPEFTAYSDGKSVEREQSSVRTAQFAVGGLSPVIVESPSIQFPIIVISEEAIAKAEDYRLQAQGLVLDQVSANGMGLLLNDITKFEGQMVKNLKEVKKPLAALEDRIDEACAKGLTPLREAKVQAKANLDKWIADQKEIQAAEQREFDRKRLEAEAAERKAREEGLEAARRAQAATNEKDRAKALEDAKQAALRRLEAEQAAQVPAPIAQEPIKVAGVKVKQVPEFEVLDFKAMPDMFKLTNDALLKKAIESGGVTEKDTWVKIKWVDKSQSTGRR